MKNPKVSIIMGSTSDLPVMEQAAKIMDEFEIPFEIHALSAHRTPEQAMDFAKKQGLDVKFYLGSLRERVQTRISRRLTPVRVRGAFIA